MSDDTWRRHVEAVEWARALDDEGLMMHASAVDQIIRDRNAVDRTSAWRGPWNPWRELRKRWDHARLKWADLGADDGLFALLEEKRWFGNAFYSITIDESLDREQQWETLSHELVHIRRGLHALDDGISAADIRDEDKWSLQRRREEDAVDAATRRLLRRSELPVRVDA